MLSLAIVTEAGPRPDTLGFTGLERASITGKKGRARQGERGSLLASISSRGVTLSLAMISGYARKLQRCMCAGRQSESCRLRAQELSGEWGVCACEESDLRICVNVCRVYRRACVCMCVHVFFFSCVGISVRVYVCV
jgi:hypothetical protein